MLEFSFLAGEGGGGEGREGGKDSYKTNQIFAYWKLGGVEYLCDGRAEGVILPEKPLGDAHRRSEQHRCHHPPFLFAQIGALHHHLLYLQSFPNHKKKVAHELYYSSSNSNSILVAVK